MLLERPVCAETESASLPYQIGWFSTGRDPAARNLLTAVYEKRHGLEPNGVDISFVFCNYKPGENPSHKDYRERQEFFDLVDSYNIPLVALSWIPFKERYGKAWRDYYGKDMNSALHGLPNNLDVAAGFMLWVPDNVCRTRKMVNLHPAEPGGPKGTWQQVIWELMEQDADETGIMFHRLTPDLDRGPPVTFARFSLRGPLYDAHWHDYREQRKRLTLEQMKSEYPDERYPSGSHPLFRVIREQGEIREIPGLIYTVGEFARRNVRFEGDFVASRDGILKSGYDITDLVERAVM